MPSEKTKRPFEHKYFISYPIDSEKTASWFSKRPTYSIMDLLWEAGPKGLTPDEVLVFLKERRQNVGRSIVYQTLKSLYENDKVEKEWDNEARANRNILTERLLPAILDEDFEKWVDRDLKDQIETDLFPAFEKYLSQIMKLANEKKISDEFIPKKGKDGWCHRCDTSHEAEFFFLALLYHAACRFVDPSDDWKFADEELGNKISRLYADNRLADPKGLRSPNKERNM